MRTITTRFSLLLCGLAALTVSSLADAASVLVVRRETREFEAVRNSLAAEIAPSHTVKDFIVAKDTNYDDFKSAVLKAKPSLLVLMDNGPVNYALKLAQESDLKANGLRGVAAMALNLKKVLKGNAVISGVTYEVPGFSLITQFRNYVKEPIRRVLVIYRDSEFHDFIQDAKTQLEREGIALVAVADDKRANDPDKVDDFIAEALQDKAAGGKIDAVWVLSDNVLMTQRNFGALWVARSRELKVPFLCGIEKFASKEADFCAYAAFPNLSDLGQQVAQQVLAILDDERAPSELGVSYLISIDKAANDEKLTKLGLTLNPK